MLVQKRFKMRKVHNPFGCSMGGAIS